MYLCALKIFVVSTSKSAAEAITHLFRAVTLPEDCTCEVETAAFGDPCECGTDGAVIIDRSLEQLHAYKRLGGEHLVFLASAGDLPEIDSETLSALDDLWVMPDGSSNEESLLKVYFSKLLTTLKNRFDRRRMEICFRTVIDSLPDLVWFKDNDGAHLIVNDAFCGVVAKTKEQIYKKHHNYIWDVPEDDYEHGEGVCRQSEEVVIRERKTCQFEEQITTKDGTRQLITFKSPLIDSDGSIFGTCGMGHDATDLRNATKELRIIIDSIPFGMAITNKDGVVFAINRFFERFFPNTDDIIGHHFKKWYDALEKEKRTSSHGEVEYRMVLGGSDHIMRFREEPIFDIFGENIGHVQIIRDVTIQYNYEQQNLKHANTDFLTGLHNRRSLFDHLTALDGGSKISMIMLDLDKFKSVNDTFGHAAGDEALEITSRTLEECFPDGFIARLGGDEFLISLTGEHDMSEVEQRTQNLLDVLLKKYATKEEFHALSASAGIAQERLQDCDIRYIENLMNHCDTALYDAKESGRARYCVYHP